MEKLTKHWLQENNACVGGINWFLAQTEKNTKKVLLKLINENHADWANWTIVRIMNKKQKVRYAIFAASQVLNIFEEKYPDDKRPRKAIEAAQKYITDATFAADAVAAADAAAFAAAADAAYAAAYATYAAAYAEDADAVAAADAAAAAYAGEKRKELQIQIITYGINILKLK